MIGEAASASPSPDALQNPVVAVENLTKLFRHAEEDIRSVDDVSFTIASHEFVAISGPSGCGKTTLLYILGALEEATSGSAVVDGAEVTTLTRRQQNDFRLKRVGFVFQSFNLIPNLSLVENVMLPMELAGRPRHLQEERARGLLSLVGLDRVRQGDRINKLSAGQQQRVAIARALANDPAVILADEPTGNLDSKNGGIVVDVLRNLADRKQATIILATHDTAITQRADRRLEIEDGRLVGAR